MGKTIKTKSKFTIWIKNLQEKNNLAISEKYTRASISFQQEKKDEAKVR